MSGGLHLDSGRVIISRDIVMEGATGRETVGILNHFERFGRLWIDIRLHPHNVGLGYEEAALKIILDRFTEMKIPTVSMMVEITDDYLGRILMRDLGFTVFRITGGSSLLEKHLI